MNNEVPSHVNATIRRRILLITVKDKTIIAAGTA